MAEYALPKGATAAEFSAARWGGPTRQTQRLVTIGTSPGELVGNNPRRVFWVSQNRSANDISWGDNRDVTTGNGFLIPASGGVASMDVLEDAEAVTYAEFAVGGAAGLTVRVMEVERV